MVAATDRSAQNGEPSTGADKRDSAESAGVVPPELVRFWQDDLHRLCVAVDGREFTDVRVVRVFPISEKADYVSFLDKEDKEVALVAHPDKLDDESRRELDSALQKMYYVAKIVRIYSITEKMGVAHWQVMTDRGYATFEVVDRQQVRSLPAGRFLIVDADGNRFEIEDVSELDVRSQALIRSET